MKRIATCSVALLMCACDMNSNAKNLAECERAYQQIEHNTILATPLKKAKAMQDQDKSCLGTGMYDVWLASYYQDAGDYPASVKIVQSALDKMKTEAARPNLLHLLVEAEVAIGDKDKAVKMAEAISHDYPEYSPILLFLTQEGSKRENWQKALEYAQQGYKVSHNVIFLLASAGPLHQLERHEETVNAVYKALDIEPDRIGKITGILEAIFSLAILNRRHEAAELAKRHIAANPNWRNNPTFAQAAKELEVEN